MIFLLRYGTNAANSFTSPGSPTGRPFGCPGAGSSSPSKPRYSLHLESSFWRKSEKLVLMCSVFKWNGESEVKQLLPSMPLCHYAYVPLSALSASPLLVPPTRRKSGRADGSPRLTFLANSEITEITNTAKQTSCPMWTCTFLQHNQKSVAFIKPVQLWPTLIWRWMNL